MQNLGLKIFIKMNKKFKEAWEELLILEKSENQEARLDLDTMKAMMNQENQEDKLQQNEELAGLRAGVSLAKQQMSDASKIHDFGRNFPKK